MCNFFVLHRFYTLALGKNSNTRFLLDQKRFAYTAGVVITLALAANMAACVAAAVFNSKLYLPFPFSFPSMGTHPPSHKR